MANPFAATTESDDPTEPATGSWFVDRGLPPPPPPGSRTLVQVIGDQGMGKSTHVAEWRRITPAELHYIPRRPYRDRWQAPPVADVVYGDEIDRMPVLLRARWLRRLASLDATVVVGTHRDLTRVARQAGLAVRTHHLQPVTRTELAMVLERRLRSAALDGREVTVGFTSADVDEVFAASGGNLRAADSMAHRILAERVRQGAEMVRPVSSGSSG